MASIQSRTFTILLRLINKRGFLGRQLKKGRFNRFDYPEPPASLFGRVEKTQLQGRNIFTLRPTAEHNAARHVLYLHGGAYVQGLTLAHWYFLSEIIKGTGTTITVPDYPLAPGATYRESFALVETLYQQLITTCLPSNIVLMGDSAGGGFALALAQKLKADNVPVPGKIILLSPWLDISLKNPAIDLIDPHDPFLDRISLQKAGKLYAGGTSPDHYQLSPINGKLEGLGRIAVFAGSNEILTADARKLKAMTPVKGTELDYYEYPGMVHTWMLLTFPESKKARRHIIDLIRDV
jgi:acetyl esterase/lipase